MTKKKSNSESDETIPTFLRGGSLEPSVLTIVVAGIVRLATQSVKGVINVGGAGVVELPYRLFRQKRIGTWSLCS